MDQFKQNLKIVEATEKEKYDVKSKNRTQYTVGDLELVQKKLEGTKRLKQKWDRPFRIIKKLLDKITYISKQTEKKAKN